jgi:hypothetical protein
MGWDVQINPTAEAHGVTWELVDLLDGFVEDFHMRYCFISKRKQALAALRAFQAERREDGAVVKQIIEHLENGDEVELLFGN